MHGHVLVLHLNFSLPDTVLDGNSKAASLLANVVHQEITMATPSDLDAVEAEVDMNNVGIWIDPIGGYLRGVRQNGMKTL